MSKCPPTCPECRGRGELVLLTSKVPCSQPWRGGRIPLSGACALVESMPPEAKERMAESFRQAYPGVRLLERMASVDGEAFSREYRGEFISNMPNAQRLPRSTNPCAEIRLDDELLCLGGPKHGQFVQCPPFGRFQVFGEERHEVNPFRPSRIDRTSVQIHTYEPRKVVVGGRTVRVMVLQGEDLSEHLCFLSKMQKLLGGKS